MDLFQIVGKLSIDGVDKAEKELNSVTNSGEKASGKMGKILSGLGKTTLAITGAVATGSVALIKNVSSSYGALQQSIGGVETLFGKSAKKVIENANNAFRTAGMSANDYMQQVTSFSASLLQSLGGDTKKACDVADRAMIDMSDNANKMGTSMESITNAYQGFAKQNYTMLDNLKLGYGGTKGEMKRLIKDASQMTATQKELGVTVDGSSMSFANIINAISVMQKELGIAGTTSKEAGSTIEGSFNSLSASWQNFVAGLGNPDADMKVLVDNLAKGLSGAINNVTPIINNMVAVLPTVMDAILKTISSMLPNLINTFTQLITKVIDAIVKLLPKFIPLAVKCILTVSQALIENLPLLIDAGILLLTSLIEGINTALPTLVPVIIKVIEQITKSLMQNLPLLLNAGLTLLKSIVTGIVKGIPKMLPKVLTFIQQLADKLSAEAPKLITMGFELLMALIKGLISALPILIEQVPTIVSTFANIINDNMPMILLMGATLLMELIKGIISVIPTLVKNAGKILKAIIDVIMAFQWLNLGKKIITGFANGIKSMVGAVKKAGTNILTAMKNAIMNLPTTLKTIGSNGVKGLINGAKSLVGSLKNVATTLFNTIFNTLKTLPSKMLNIGKDLVKGIFNGISDMTGWIMDKITGFGDAVVNRFKKVFKINSPSKVMAEEVGVFLTQGVGVGIEDDDSAEKSIRNKMSSILDVANGSVGNIKLGASVDNLITQSPMQKYSLDFNAQISSLNDSFERLISLVGSYLPNIANELDRPIVLDGDSLVVGMSRKMDSQLGKIAVSKGRGNV